MLGFDEYLIVSHSSMYVLNTISGKDMKIYDFEEVGEYNFKFKSSIFNRKKIRLLFPNIVIVRSSGAISLFANLFKYKIIFFSLILSFVFYMSLSSYIWRINVNGNNDRVNEIIYTSLEYHGIDKGHKLLDFDDLEKLENDMYDELEEYVEWLEIRQKGCNFNVSYLKRREEVEESVSRGKIYASRDSVIQSINIESGVVLVKENQYVKKGDLLVDDIVEVSSGGFEFVPTKGNIFGVTWYIIDVEIECVDDEYIAFEKAIEEANNELKDKVTNIIYVKSQNVLKYEKESSIIRIRIHYEVLEDISIT